MLRANYGLPEVNFKVNMPVHFLEINEHTLGKPGTTSSGGSIAPWKLLARCEGNAAESCVLIKRLKEIKNWQVFGKNR